MTDLGRKQTHDQDTGSVERDTRVVWVKNTPGTGRTLYYQSQEGDFDPSVVHPGDPGTGWAFPDEARSPHAFGPRSPRESAKLGRPVPAEFVETAVARSEQLWGATETIDPGGDWLATQGYDPTRRPAPPARKSEPTSNQIVYSMLVGDDDDVTDPKPKTWPQPVDVFKQKPKGVLVPQQDPQ